MRPFSHAGERLRRRLRRALAFGAICALGALPAYAVDSPAAAPAAIEGPYVVVDAGTGRVLAHRDARRPWYPASTTKLMTAYVAFRAVDAGELTLASPVTISANAAAEAPSKMGFPPGTEITLDAALKMMMVKSANDIAVAVAETVAGSVEAFAGRMNREAARLGMERSHFVNPNGLPDPRQVTSARDMALLAQTLLVEFPEYRDYLRVHAIEVGGAILKNFNPLLERFPGATGMKTGFICASGYNLVASARRGEREIVAVVFGEYGGKARAEAAAALLDEGFLAAAQVTEPPVTLATVASGGEYAAPFDMRPLVCSPGRAAAASDAAGADAKDGEAAAPATHLVAPIYLGPPERLVVHMPSSLVMSGFARLPRPRPDRLFDLPEAGVADAFAPPQRPAEGAPVEAIGAAVGAPRALDSVEPR
jgi:D-alanyl-D-alanine carboxypeptidase